MELTEEIQLLIKKYIKENLTITIESDTDYEGDSVYVRTNVCLYMDGDCISSESSSTSLPTQ